MRYLGGPVAVGVAGVQTVVEGLHEAVELRPESRFKRLQMALAFPPLGSSVFKPDLQHMEYSN